MNAPAESIEQVYQAELEPLLAELEEQRIRTRNYALLNAPVVLLAAVAAFFLLCRFIGFGALVVALIAGSLVWFAFNGKKFREYRQSFKNRIIRRLVQFAGPDLAYEPDRGIIQAEFRSSKLFRTGVDRYSSEDLLKGKIGETEFRLSEVHAEYKSTTRDSKGRTQTSYHTIFRGIFFIGDFHKNFQGETFLLPDTAESMFGNFGQMLQSWTAKLGARGELVKLEDPEFEKRFVVLSTDQIEARYILSLSLMARLAQFRDRMKERVHVSFVDSKIYIAVSTMRNFFEPPSIMFGSARLSFDGIRQYLDDVRFAEGIVEELNLNTRIWSKQ